MPGKKKQKSVESVLGDSQVGIEAFMQRANTVSRSIHEVDDDVQVVEDVVPRSHMENCFDLVERNTKGDLALFFQGFYRSEFAATDFTVSLTRNGGDLDPHCLDRAKAFLQMFSQKGVAVLEVGKKEKHLHLHMIFRELMDSKVTQKLRTFVKSYLLGKIEKNSWLDLPSGVKNYVTPTENEEWIDICKKHKMQIKPITNGDTFESQVGYVMKDLGAAHFRCMVYNSGKRDQCYWKEMTVHSKRFNSPTRQCPPEVGVRKRLRSRFVVCKMS